MWPYVGSTKIRPQPDPGGGCLPGWLFLQVVGNGAAQVAAFLRRLVVEVQYQADLLALLRDIPHGPLPEDFGEVGTVRLQLLARARCGARGLLRSYRGPFCRVF